MTETIAQYFVDNFSDVLSDELIVFIVSMLPILELRGGLIVAKLLEVSFFKAFAICFIGNLLPIPFILLFIRRIFSLLKKISSVVLMTTELFKCLKDLTNRMKMQK